MQLFLLALDHLTNSAAHFLDQKHVQIRVKMVALVFFKAFDSFRFSEMFTDDSHDGFFHLFFQDVVLASLIDFVQKLFFTLLIPLLTLLVGHRLGKLFL